MVIDEFGSQVVPVDGWDSMGAWLVESFGAMGVGSVLDVGLQGATIYSPNDEIACAQVRKLENDVLWLRLSDRVMGFPNVTNLRTDGLLLDLWQREDLLEDCTEGQLFTADHELVAEACMSWFRDARAIGSPDELGCQYEAVDQLPRHRGEHPPRPPSEEALSNLHALAEDFALGRFSRVEWEGSRSMGFQSGDVHLMIFVRPKKKRLDVFAPVSVEWIDDLPHEMLNDFAKRLSPLRITEHLDLTCISDRCEVDSAIRTRLLSATDSTARIVRSVEGRSSELDLVFPDVKEFGRWRLDWGLVDDR